MSNTQSVITIRSSVAEFNTGFNEAVGPVLAEVFAVEQKDLVSAGLPAAIVAAGDALPDATLVRADGSTVSLSDELAGSPAVLVFYRGAWCPYCNITLKHYNEDLAPALAERGVRLVAISPQTPEGTEAAILKDDLSFTVLSDPANALASRFGIVTAPSAAAQDAHGQLGFAVADSNADATAAIPFPTVLVISANGLVSFADVHVDYTSRTEVPVILEAVDAL
jgi:peroxiredoxin